jgi:hypothetical protein
MKPLGNLRGHIFNCQLKRRSTDNEDNSFFFQKKTILDNDTINDTIITVAKIDDILAQMKQNPRDVRFSDLCKACEHFFGEPRQSGSSHRIYKTPWQGDPRINIQNYKGKAKSYQVKQVLLAIERLEVDHGSEK